DLKGNAMYFSRSPIPFRRSSGPAGYLKHLGLYAYRRKFLLRFASWPPTPVEKTEQLEQMRILEKGYPIGVVLSKHDSFGVDVPSDIRKIERLLK
ncbi:MAG: cytidylyltransferase domain-containing protein, partial [Endomicrobiales bacterium]